MPVIIIKDYTWRQTSETILIYVPVKNHPKSVDLFAVNNYVKVSFAPFILELFLWSDIVEEESKCTVSEEQLILSLTKADVSLNWDSLQLDNLSKDEKRMYRNQALELAQNKAEDDKKAKSEKRQQLQKDAVRAQIDLDTAVLNKISAIRDAHRKEAMEDFQNWKYKDEMPILKDIDGVSQENRKAYRPPLKWFKDKKGEVKNRKMTKEEIFGADEVPEVVKQSDKKIELNVEEISKSQSGEVKGQENIPKDLKANSNESSCSEDSESDYEDKLNKSKSGWNKKGKITSNKIQETKKKKLTVKEMVERATRFQGSKLNNIFDSAEAVPLPRKTGTINFTFSERAFPTPTRESLQVEEEEWLAKQVEARRKIGFAAEDLRPEEQDPQWLKDKGDEFFNAGNYKAAISAYSHGIKISDKMVPLYVNRSAAHYALENYYRCTMDCSKALELMEPKCEGNRESRARCHARRGAALCKLSAPQHGIPELEEALKLTPDNESIKRDLWMAKQYFDIKD